MDMNDADPFHELEGLALDYWDALDSAQDEIRKIEIRLNQVGCPELDLPHYGDLNVRRSGQRLRIFIGNRTWTESPHHDRFKTIPLISALPAAIVAEAKRVIKP